MPEFTIKEYTNEEYLRDLSEEIKRDGLLKSVEKRCDEINEESSGLRYVAHRSIQELLVEILDLIRMREGQKDGMD